MKAPAQFKNINGKRYVRGIWDTTRNNALRSAKEQRVKGFLARAVKQDNGKYAVYIRVIGGS